MNKRGSVLMISLWILALLALFAVGLGHRAAIALRLARYQRDKLSAYALARAAIYKTIGVVNKDQNAYDSPKEWAENISGADPAQLFSYVEDKQRYAKAGYSDSDGKFVYGFSDEDGKINLNGTLDFDITKLTEVLSMRSVPDAGVLASTIVGWMKGDDSSVTITKRELLRVPEEVLFILEYFYQEIIKTTPENILAQTRETFSKIEDILTVYGYSTINVNTASESALRALCIAVAKDVSKTQGLTMDGQTVGESIAKRLVQLRNSSTLKLKEDMVFEGLSSDEIVVLNELENKRLAFKSDFFRIEATGYANDITKRVVAVYDRKNTKIVYWHEY